MFDNYSLSDLWSNVYKNRKKNIIIALVVFVAILTPFIIKATQSGEEEKQDDGINYSTYMAYNVDSEQVIIQDDMITEPYSEFYKELLNSNLNGCYLFSDISEKELKMISQELSIDTVQLKNSDSNYWYGKIVVNSMSNIGMLSIKILTPSKRFNEIVSEKVDILINQNKIDNVQVNKISELSTSDVKVMSDNKIEINSKSEIDKNLIFKGAILSLAFAVFFILGINFIIYIFNPSINEGENYRNYKLDFIYDFETATKCVEILKYKQKASGDFVLVASKKCVLEKFQNCMKKENVMVPSPLLYVDDVQGIIASKAIIFVEEYGVTRYKTFENALRQAKNINKPVIGVISLPL